MSEDPASYQIPSGQPRPTPGEERMLRWFECQHLPEHLQATAFEYGILARYLVDKLAPGPERTVALRFLLQSKDAAVRATLHPGG